MSEEYWYRYYDMQYAPSLDEWDNPVGVGQVRVLLAEYSVLSLTPCGAWLLVNGDRRWTKKDVIRHFACPTLEEAKESFVARKRKQISIYQARIVRAERAIKLI